MSRQGVATEVVIFSDSAYPYFITEGRGACADDPFPDDFTEDGLRPWQKAQRERARLVCYECPFRAPCRQWAAETGQQGMYGGVSTRERRRGYQHSAA